MPTDELIGKRIQEIRIRRGMTQEQLADRIHISKSSISEWEACKRVPQMKTLRKIAEALGVDVWEIIGFNDVSIDPAQQAREELADDPDRKARVMARTSMGHLGNPIDVGWAITYLCSEAASYDVLTTLKFIGLFVSSPIRRSTLGLIILKS